MTFYLLFKRIFDIVASFFGLIITSPIWLLAIIGIEASDKGPIFYIANRIGKDNKHFFMYKFRSMRIDNEANEGQFKADSSRVFKWGRFMRSTKIDELPQLLNVLKGDMSVVGPRPASQDQVDVVRCGKYNIISKVLPGLTGPAALYDYIYGDYITDEIKYREKILPTRMELEVFYLENMSFCFDIKMIWWTVLCIFNSMVYGNNLDRLEKLKNYLSLDKLMLRNNG